MGAAQLVPSVSPPALSPQPLSVQQSSTGKVESHPSRKKPVDCLSVKSFDFLSVREQSATPRLNGKSPVRSACVGGFRQMLQSRPCLRCVTRAAGRFNQLDRRPPRIPEIVGVLERLHRSAKCVFVLAECIAEDRRRP